MQGVVGGERLEKVAGKEKNEEEEKSIKSMEM